MSIPVILTLIPTPCLVQFIYLNGGRCVACRVPFPHGLWAFFPYFPFVPQHGSKGFPFPSV